MKKVLLIVILLLGIGGAGAGYYLFFVKPQQDTEVTEMTDASQTGTDSKMKSSAPAKPAPFKVQDYYVKERKVAVRSGAGAHFLPERYLYIGNTVTVLEEKDGWGRISNFYVYKQGGKEIAEWVKMAYLSRSQPIISAVENDEIIASYIGQSDDFKEYREKFVKVTDKLLKEKICTPEDFEELNGWMRSINYSDRHVYFVYCGGLAVSDKIYYDADSEEIFYK